MSYTSLSFFIFVFVSITAYFVFPLKKYKWTVLLAASYAFYLFFGYKYVFYIIFTTLVTYITALLTDRIGTNGKTALDENKALWNKEQKKAFKAKLKTRKKLILAACLIINFGILCFLKYYNFLAEGLNTLFFSSGTGIPVFKLILPLGISFYTFQAMGYVIDVYREKVKAERNFFKLALFVSFFPQIIQGPISFYSQLASQLYESHPFSFNRLKHGCELMLWGFFKKLVIADRALVAISGVLEDYTSYNGVAILVAALMYALQLYADFSAGIDISRGIAQILGIDMAQNFRRPYFSRSISEYWRRWHITLGAWMKDYLFYPIATSSMFMGISKRIKGTKFGKTKAGAHVAKVLATSVASLAVFFIVGIWHGANTKYVAFGLWNGGIIMLSTLLKPCFDFVRIKLRIKETNPFFIAFQLIRTFVVVLVGYYFDIAPNAKGAIVMMYRSLTSLNVRLGLRQILTLQFRLNDCIILFFCTAIMLLVSIIQERASDASIRVMLDKRSVVVRWGVIFVAIMAIILLGVYGPGYNQADFVYGQF